MEINRAGISHLLYLFIANGSLPFLIPNLVKPVLMLGLFPIVTTLKILRIRK